MCFVERTTSWKYKYIFFKCTILTSWHCLLGSCAAPAVSGCPFLAGEWWTCFAIRYSGLEERTLMASCPAAQNRYSALFPLSESCWQFLCTWRMKDDRVKAIYNILVWQIKGMQGYLFLITCKQYSLNSIYYIRNMGYWPSVRSRWLDFDQFFYACLWAETEWRSTNMQKKWLRPISSQLNQTNLVNKRSNIRKWTLFSCGTQLVIPSAILST